jgi:hypothetical protein
MIEATPPPAPPSPEVQMAINEAVDRDRLKLLEVAYYLSGGVTILFVSFLLIHFTLFLVLGLNPQVFAHTTGSNGHPAAPPPPGIFLVFAALIGLIILLGWTFGGLQIYAGRCLKHRRHRLFILVVAGIECIFIPWGTLLGICTFLTLERPSLKYRFAKTERFGSGKAQ